MDPRDIARGGCVRLRSRRVIPKLSRGYVPVTYRPLGRARGDDPPGCARVRVRAFERALIEHTRNAPNIPNITVRSAFPYPPPCPSRVGGRGMGTKGQNVVIVVHIAYRYVLIIIIITRDASFAIVR